MLAMFELGRLVTSRYVINWKLARACYFRDVFGAVRKTERKREIIQLKIYIKIY